MMISTIAHVGNPPSSSGAAVGATVVVGSTATGERVAVGAAVGTGVGAAVGMGVGATVGTGVATAANIAVGLGKTTATVGSGVGVIVGATVGSGVGVGVIVGATVGSGVGVGAIVGATVGSGVGVGAIVGATVGSGVGVGAIVGATVGSGVGVIVGAGVGVGSARGAAIPPLPPSLRGGRMVGVGVGVAVAGGVWALPWPAAWVGRCRGRRLDHYLGIPRDIRLLGVIIRVKVLQNTGEVVATRCARSHNSIAELFNLVRVLRDDKTKDLTINLDIGVTGHNGILYVCEPVGQRFHDAAISEPAGGDGYTRPPTRGHHRRVNGPVSVGANHYPSIACDIRLLGVIIRVKILQNAAEGIFIHCVGGHNPIAELFDFGCHLRDDKAENLTIDIDFDIGGSGRNGTLYISEPWGQCFLDAAVGEPAGGNRYNHLAAGDHRRRLDGPGGAGRLRTHHTRPQQSCDP